MARKVLNKTGSYSAGLSKYNETMYGVAGHKKVVVIEIDDMSAVADGDEVYTIPTDAVLDKVMVKNIGSTAFSFTGGDGGVYIDDGTNHLTGALESLAAGATEYTYVQPAKKSAGTKLQWDLAGSTTAWTNGSASTAKARVVIEFTTFENAGI